MAHCTCKVGPGKFEGESALTFMAYQQMCLGNVDTTIGRYDFFKAPFNFDADQEVVKAAQEYGYCDECIENYCDRSEYGMAIWEDDNGFVYSRVFTSEKDYDDGIEKAEQEDAESGEEN